MGCFDRIYVKADFGLYMVCKVPLCSLLHSMRLDVIHMPTVSVYSMYTISPLYLFSTRKNSERDKTVISKVVMLRESLRAYQMEEHTKDLQVWGQR